jgi:hypothetical protein
MPLSVQWTVPLCVAANISFPFHSWPKVEAALHRHAAGNCLFGVANAFTCPPAPSSRTAAAALLN